jgi:hypothetical protein
LRHANGKSELHLTSTVKNVGDVLILGDGVECKNMYRPATHNVLTKRFMRLRTDCIRRAHKAHSGAADTCAALALRNVLHVFDQPLIQAGGINDNAPCKGARFAPFGAYTRIKKKSSSQRIY